MTNFGSVELSQYEKEEIERIKNQAEKEGEKGDAFARYASKLKNAGYSELQIGPILGAELERIRILRFVQGI